MSKYIYEEGDISVKSPKCTSCEEYKKEMCKIYGKNIPKKIRYEFADCSHHVKIKQ
jgi:hypothetical protein